MSILDVENLSFSYQNEVLLHNVNMRLFSSDHAVLVGPNGSGKSTLLKLINKMIRPDAGEVMWQNVKKIGYLDQYKELPKNLTVISYLYDVFSPLVEKEKEMEGLYSKAAIDLDNFEKILNRATMISEELEEAGYYALNSRINNVIGGLGMDEVVLNMPIKHLSGGMRAKVILAKLLLDEADVLLLDEPTNFLDSAHIDWLAKFLKKYEKAFIVISHHEAFMKEIATCVFALEGAQITRYKGDYHYYLNERVVRFEHQEKAFVNQQKEINKMEDFIQKNLVRATTTKRAQSRRKMLDKIVRVEKPKSDKTYKFTFPLASGTGKEVLTVTDLLIGYNEPLLEPINLIIRRGEKVVITGKNGIGKSTFIKTILQQTPALDGSFSWIDTAKMAYLAQDGDFGVDDTPFSVVHNHYPNFTREQVMKQLGEYGINFEMASRKLRSLSGGEQTKVRLSLLKHQKGNVLILDEPTNHLDYAAKIALQEALIKYQGTLILVSHESAFYGPVCDYELSLFNEESGE